jgi:hypothetical protein
MPHVRRRPLGWAGAVALLLAALCLSAAPRLGSPAASADGPTVSIDPAQVSALPGETVDVTVVIADVSDLYSAYVHLTFDPTLLEVVDADGSRQGVQVFPGTFPGPSEGPGDVTTNAVDNAAGTIDYDFTLLDPAPAVSGTGVLARIRFRGKANGESAITLEQADLWDAAHQPIAATTGDGPVQLGDAPTDTPAPTDTVPATGTPTATTTRTNTPTPVPTRTPQPTHTPKPTATSRPSATPTDTPAPNPPMDAPQPTTAAVAAAAAKSTPAGEKLPSAGTGELPSQIWRWFFFSGAIILGLATWAFTFRFYARQKEAERFWHR